MKVFQEQSDYSLPQSIREGLEIVRKYRNFNVEQYVQAKAELLNSYMEKSKLQTCIVAVSGGIDSAVVFAICDYASRLKHSPINVVPVSLPAFDNQGVTNQESATDKARILVEKFGYHHNVIEVGDSANTIEDAVAKMFRAKGCPWAVGQLVPYTRTPTLYYLASQYSDIGMPAVIVGTTNRDEGAYLGYVGKASDGMVDLQLISDLHKSEVYACAKYLGVVDEIINAVPTGDMYDGRTDIEVFGAPYEIVELMLAFKNLPFDVAGEVIGAITKTDEGLEKWAEYCTNVENLHKYNQHKYYIGSPAVHLDIYPSGVNGGWELDFEDKYRANLFEVGNVIKKAFVSPVGFENEAAQKFREYYYNRYEELVGNDPFVPVVQTHGEVKIIENMLTEKEAVLLEDIFCTNKKLQANVHGRLDAMNTENSGSSRVSWYNIEFADLLWKRLRGIVDNLVKCDRHTIPGEKNKLYRAVGINPLMRYIGYENNGMLVPHFDYPFKQKNGILSLYTVVLYLTTNETGATRFIKEVYPEIGKNLDDWSYEDAVVFNHTSTPYDFSLENKPVRLQAAIFPHYMLHDCEQVIGENKLIIRTDIMFEEIKFS